MSKKNITFPITWLEAKNKNISTNDVREFLLGAIIDGNLEEVIDIVNYKNIKNAIIEANGNQAWYMVSWATRSGHTGIIDYFIKEFELHKDPAFPDLIKGLVKQTSSERVEVYEYYFKLLAHDKRHDTIKSVLSCPNIEASAEKEKITHIALSLIDKNILEEQVSNITLLSLPLNETKALNKTNRKTQKI